MSITSSTSIIWFTSNLRTIDNYILKVACEKYDRVVGFYCFNQSDFKKNEFGFKKTEKFRAKFLIESVNNLSQNLKKLNIPLFVFYGDPAEKLPKFCKNNNATALLFQNEFTEQETKLITKINSKLHYKISIHSYFDQFLFHPHDLIFDLDKTPEVFSSYRKKVEKYVTVKKCSEIQPKNPSNWIPVTTKIPDLQTLGFTDFSVPTFTAFPFEGGQDAAMNRLQYYFFKSRKLGSYKETRNGLLGVNYSSKFSPWLGNGSISAKTLYWEIKKYEKKFGKNQSTYWLIFELIWRDYFKCLAYKHRTNLFTLGGIKRKKYNWNTDEVSIQSWINGHTLNDFVNANMIELKTTGWMSNRGRQNVASFFAKELLLDWRIGAAYFESMLIDYDVHSNYGNWQYVAGVGNDPRDRKFDVAWQSEKYDADRKFRNRWLQLSY